MPVIDLCGDKFEENRHNIIQQLMQAATEIGFLQVSGLTAYCLYTVHVATVAPYRSDGKFRRPIRGGLCGY